MFVPIQWQIGTNLQLKLIVSTKNHVYTTLP